MTDFKAAAEELDSRYEAEAKRVSEKYEQDILIVDGKPHLKIERDGSSAFCYFDHRFWFKDNDERYPRYPWMVCKASEDYREETPEDENIYRMTVEERAKWRNEQTSTA